MQKLTGFLASLLMLLGTLTVSAQSLSISGRVVDASGEPLIAVTVFEDGNTANGTMTDIDGNYTLNVSSAKATIVFSLPHNEGSLSQVLSIFSFYRINLTKIQSLPIIGREWEYLFYVDVIFNDYLRFRQSIDAVSPLTKELKVLGEYEEGKSTL